MKRNWLELKAEWHFSMKAWLQRKH